MGMMTRLKAVCWLHGHDWTQETLIRAGVKFDVCWRCGEWRRSRTAEATGTEE